MEGDRDGEELRERQNVSREKIRRQHGARRRGPHRHPHPQRRVRGSGKNNDSCLKLKRQGLGSLLCFFSSNLYSKSPKRRKFSFCQQFLHYMIHNHNFK